VAALQLLRSLNLHGAIISDDAMFAQRTVSTQVNAAWEQAGLMQSQ